MMTSSAWSPSMSASSLTAQPKKPPVAPCQLCSTRTGSTNPLLLCAAAPAGAASARASVTSVAPRSRIAVPPDRCAAVLRAGGADRFHDRAQFGPAQRRRRAPEGRPEAVAEVAGRAVAEVDGEPRQGGVRLGGEAGDPRPQAPPPHAAGGRGAGLRAGNAAPGGGGGGKRGG